MSARPAAPKTAPIDERYELTETPSHRYDQRTEWNVRDSDATVVFSIAREVTGGTALTLAIAERLGKPCLHLASEAASATASGSGGRSCSTFSPSITSSDSTSPDRGHRRSRWWPRLSAACWSPRSTAAQAKRVALMSMKLEISPEKTRIGWIGTGVMGRSMCGHLLDAGYTVDGLQSHQVEGRRARRSAAPRWADSPRDVAAASDVVFSIVGYPDDVREVLTGRRTARSAARKPAACSST